MSTLKTTNLQHASAANPAIVLAANGSATAQLSSLNGGPLAGSRQRIINGDMRIDQRNDGGLITNVANAAYMIDRFQTYHDIGTFNAQRNLNALTPPVGFTNYLGFTNTSASTSAAANYFNFNTGVEGLNWGDLGWGASGAQAVTLSFWVRSSIAGAYSVAFNGQNTYGYPAAYTISSANAWEFKTITVPGPTAGTWTTDNTRALSVIWDLGQGSSFRFAAGSWQAGTVQGATGSTNWNQTNGATFFITGVQLEPGTVATPFERRSFGQELALCERYFQQAGSGAVGAEEGTAAASFGIDFNVPMRATPTASLITADLQVRWFSGAGAGDRTMAGSSINGATALSARGCWLYLNIPGGVAARLVINRNASSWLNLSAEL